jgi:hypothetical protein
MINKLKIQNTSEIILHQIKARDNKILDLENEIIVLEEKLKKYKNTIGIISAILIISLISNLILLMN